LNRSGAIVLTAILLSATLAGCGLGGKARLKKRAEDYYRAMMYNDYDTLYEFQAAQTKAQVSREEFIAFMEDRDTSVDFSEFTIDSVVIRGQGGKVRLRFKGGYLIFRGKRNVTSSWIREGGQWYIEKDPRGRFWSEYANWLAERRMYRVPAIRSQLERLSEEIEDFHRTEGRYPSRLEELGQPGLIIDPNSQQRPLRYYSDGRTFWIVAANGPDGKPDMDVQLYQGEASQYPPPELVYDPLTDRGDFFQYGPKKKKYF